MVRRTLRGMLARARGFSDDVRAYLIASMLHNIAFGMGATVFAVYVKASGFSESTVGTLVGTTQFMAAIACLLMPPLVAILGYRRTLAWGFALMAVARVAQASTPEMAVLVGGAIGLGWGEGTQEAIAPALLSTHSSQDEKTAVFSANAFVGTIGYVVGTFGAGWMSTLLERPLGEVAAYQWILAGAGALLLVSAVPMWARRDRIPSRRAAFGEYVRGLRQFGSWRHVGRLLLVQAWIPLGAGLVMPFVALFLRHRLGASMGQVGLILGLDGVAIALAVLTVPALTRRFGVVRTWVTVEALSLPLMLAVPLTSSLTLVAVLLVTRAALMNMGWPLFNQMSMEGVPVHERPVVAGTLAFMWNVGFFVGSISGGMIMETSYTLPWFMAVVPYALSVIATWIVFRGREPSRPVVDEVAPHVEW